MLNGLFIFLSSLFCDSSYKIIPTPTGARAAQRADAEKFTAMRKAQREADKARGQARSRHMTEVIFLA